MDKFLLQLDLNLLKSLYVLLQERNVTRAADKMFITQSAMSKTLKRLREAFDDPLLVKTTSGLVSTPLAEELVSKLGGVFDQLITLNAVEFDPKTACCEIRIASPETFALTIVPTFINQLKKNAPNVQVELLHLEDNYTELLASGEIDFVLYLEQEYPESLISHFLSDTAARIWFRSGHPLAEKEKLSLEDVCNYPKIAFHSPNILPSELSYILHELEIAELNREVLLKTSHMLVALTMLVDSDALMTAPDYFFYPLKDIVSRSINHIPLFANLEKFNIELVQHERTIKSPIHKWIIQEIKQSISNNSNYLTLQSNKVS
jgi:DNA-binding transcriptional LysR family regulator